MQNSSVNRNLDFYKGKKVFVTGHTGFKGSWLTVMLRYLGADIMGYSLAAEKGCLYEQIEGDELAKSVVGDLCDRAKLHNAIQTFKPEIIIHLAAFGFVNECFEDPVRAYQTNLMGSLNLLEEVRFCESVKSVVMVSTDKVYLNEGDGVNYSEDSRLGGLGPYSASKTCMENLVADYRNTYLMTSNKKVGIATVRASNVLGGGDHIESRLIPSILKAVDEHRKVELRNPDQIRPWQSVLDALNAYLTIGRYLYCNPEDYSEAWNVGPRPEGIKSVSWIFNEIKQSFGALSEGNAQKFRINESKTLGLDIRKILQKTDWEPRLSTEELIYDVVSFYQRRKDGDAALDICLDQIENFFSGVRI